jgi:Putative metallopeptidase
MRPAGYEQALRKIQAELGRLQEWLKFLRNVSDRVLTLLGPRPLLRRRKCAAPPIVSAILCALPLLTTPVVAAGKPDRIRVEYVPPKDRAHQPIYEAIMRQRALERVRQMLSPLRLPRILQMKVEGCDGVSNAWYDEGAVTVCYEYLDELWKNMPEQQTASGIAPIDALIGPFMDVFLHEAGHAVFDILQVPLFGREEDAADQFSAYIMLRFGKAEARRLILGSAYQYKGDLGDKTVSLDLKKFSDEHGTPAQRFFNLLCIAYGSDNKLFGDLVDKGYLPKDRAEGCEGEYHQIAHAMARLIAPHVDKKLAQQVFRSQLPHMNFRPPRRSGTATRP